MSDRNAEIVRLAALSKRNGEIAAELGLTSGVVAGVIRPSGVVSPERQARITPHPAGAGIPGCRECARVSFPHVESRRAADGKFCGKRVRGPGEPYCAAHHKLTHQPYLTKLTAPSDGAPRQGLNLSTGVES